jgi:hypothetical protein
VISLRGSEKRRRLNLGFIQFLTGRRGSKLRGHEAASLTLSYVDLFRMLVIVCLLSVPLVFLFKKPKRAVVPGELAAAH